MIGHGRILLKLCIQTSDGSILAHRLLFSDLYSIAKETEKEWTIAICSRMDEFTDHAELKKVMKKKYALWFYSLKFHVNVWQNQYSTVKQNKVKIKIFLKISKLGDGDGSQWVWISGRWCLGGGMREAVYIDLCGFTWMC